MNYSLTTIGGSASEADSRRHQIIGAVCQLAAQSRSHASAPLQQMVERLRMPIELNQIRVAFNDFGQCMGYITWAYLNPEVERRLLIGESLALHDFEWNEGGSLWIIDLLVPHGSLQHMLVEMRDQLFTSSQSVTYFRFKNGKRICKKIDRRDASSFWEKK